MAAEVPVADAAAVAQAPAEAGGDVAAAAAAGGGSAASPPENMVSPSGTRKGRRQTAVLDRARTINAQDRVHKEKSLTVSATASVRRLPTEPPLPGTVEARSKSRKSVLPAFTALPLLTPEAADVILQAMRAAVDQIDSSKHNVVHLNGAEVDLLILFERFVGLCDAALRSQGADIVELFGDKDRIYKARAIAMDVEFSTRNAQDGRIKAVKDKCDAVEHFLEEYAHAPPDSSAVGSAPSRKSKAIRETLARKRRELAEQRNSSAKYRNVMWAVSWLYAHRRAKAWSDGGADQPDIPAISVKDGDGNVTIDVSDMSDMTDGEEGDEEDEDEEDDEDYDGSPSGMPRSSLTEARGRGMGQPTALQAMSKDPAQFDGFDGLGGLVGKMSSAAKRKLMAGTNPQVDIASAPAENLVLLLTEEQRARFGIGPQTSAYGQYMDLICVRSTGDYKHR